MCSLASSSSSVSQSFLSLALIVYENQSGFLTPIIYVRSIKSPLLSTFNNVCIYFSSRTPGSRNLCRALALDLFNILSTHFCFSISSRTSYDNTGQTYDVTRILTPENTFNATAYEAYSPLFLS